MFPSPGGSSRFPSVTQSNSPSAFPVRHQHRLRLIPIPAGETFLCKDTRALSRNPLSPFLASWRCGMREREASPCSGANPACACGLRLQKRSSHSGDAVRTICIPLLASALAPVAALSSQGQVFFDFGAPCLPLAKIKSAGTLQACC